MIKPQKNNQQNLSRQTDSPINGEIAKDNDSEFEKKLKDSFY